MWWHTPVVPAPLEAEAQELLELGRWILQWAEITPLYSSLGNWARLCLKKKEKKQTENALGAHGGTVQCCWKIVIQRFQWAGWAQRNVPCDRMACADTGVTHHCVPVSTALCRFLFVGLSFCKELFTYCSFSFLLIENCIFSLELTMLENFMHRLEGGRFQKKRWLVTVAHACNPNTLGGRTRGQDTETILANTVKSCLLKQTNKPVIKNKN